MPDPASCTQGTRFEEGLIEQAYAAVSSKGVVVSGISSDWNSNMW